jgi:hypothetical protein
VIVGVRPPIRIALEITLALELKGLVLNIQDATIRAIRFGSCPAEASVKCEKRVVMLPGRVDPAMSEFHD